MELIKRGYEGLERWFLGTAMLLLVYVAISEGWYGAEHINVATEGVGFLAIGCLGAILARIAQAALQHRLQMDQLKILVALLQPPTVPGKPAAATQLQQVIHPADTTTSKGGVIRNVPTAEVAQYKEKGWTVVARASTGACMRKFSG